MNSDRFASTAPAPVNMLCVRNPRASCDSGNRSEMNARYGSIEVLLPASRSQKQTTASQRMPTNGKANRMIAQRIAPASDEGSSAAPPGAPGPVADRADQRLDDQSGDRSGQVEDRELIGICADQQEERVHRRLGEAEAELDPEEPEVHHQDGRARHQRLALAHLGHIYSGRGGGGRSGLGSGHGNAPVSEKGHIMARTLLFCRILSNALGKHFFASQDAPGKHAQCADLHGANPKYSGKFSKLIYIESRNPRERNFFSSCRVATAA